MSPMPNINEQALIAFTKKLIQTPSPSGFEEVISKCIADEMTRVGFDQILIDQKHNVLGILEGHGAAASALAALNTPPQIATLQDSLFGFHCPLSPHRTRDSW